jgi:putative N6-adenine-specific DNA methylase
VAAAVSGTTPVRAAAEAEGREADVTVLPDVQRFVVRVFRDEVTLSADASGALLHRRGWRHEVARAPLRETLAAAMLLGVGWDGTTPLFDPFMGSGTIPIEAALLARRIAPGRLRRFAAEQWPMIGAGAFLAARTRASDEELARAPVAIGGADRDPGATFAAIANAERAGVVLDVALTRATVSELPRDAGRGLLLTNPPYGVRVGERTALRSLYAALGNTLREQRPHWQLAMLVNDRVLQGQVGVPLHEVWQTTHGGLPVRLVRTMDDRR